MNPGHGCAGTRAPSNVNFAEACSSCEYSTLCPARGGVNPPALSAINTRCNMPALDIETVAAHRRRLLDRLDGAVTVLHEQAEHWRADQPEQASQYEARAAALARARHGIANTPASDATLRRYALACEHAMPALGERFAALEGELVKTVQPGTGDSATFLRALCERMPAPGRGRGASG